MKKNSSTLQGLQKVVGKKKLSPVLGGINSVAKIVKKSTQFQTPCYLFDSIEVTKSYRRFLGAFTKAGVSPQVFFAVKSNPAAELIKTLSALGCGVDVSSVQELQAAQKAGAKKIIVTGPGKSIEHLKLFLAEKKVQNIYLDSPQEFERLKKIYKTGKKPANKKALIGVRIVPPSLASWDKFGVSLAEAKKLILASHMKGSPFGITALQFHISYVKNGTVFKKALQEVGEWITGLPTHIRSEIKVLDIGGGFTPETLEGVYPWNRKQLSLFDVAPLKKKIEKAQGAQRAFFEQISSIEEIAQDIASSFRRYVQPKLPNCQLHVEPGRFLSVNSMHILLSVIDKKSDDSVILDGGWNMVGWEKYQYINYCPVFNLDQLSMTQELPLLMYGNLCLPDDIWGYYLHGKGADIGDKILIPFQGAYTYTYRQSFIRGIPKVYRCR